MFSIPPVYTPHIYYSIIHSFNTNEIHIHNEIKKQFDVNDFVITNSGRSSLYLILKSLKKKYPEKYQVIITAYTCPSVVSAIRKCKLKIVLCDLKKDSFTLDISNLRELINNETLAVVTQHLFGIAEDISDQVELCRKNNIILIEDCAQSFGSEIDGEKVGTFGDIAFFSFGLGKTITATHGGLIISKNKEFISKIDNELSNYKKENNVNVVKSIFSLFIYPILLNKYFYWIIWNSRINPEKRKILIENFQVNRVNDFLKNIISWQISKLNCIQEVRKQNANVYKENINFDHIKHLGKKSQTFLSYPILYLGKKNLDDIVNSGLGISRMYKKTLNDLENISAINKSESFPNAEYLANHLLTLPVHSRLTKKNINRIITLISK